LKPTLKYAGPLVDAELADTDSQFSGFFITLHGFIIASVTLPQLKLRWLDDTG
jgi:hypothetical protein